jgi:hypothetical protein
MKFVASMTAAEKYKLAHELRQSTNQAEKLIPVDEKTLKAMISESHKS